MNIGEKIKTLRTRLDLTQEELADAAGTTKQTIHKYETGIIANIPASKVKAMADKLDTTPAFLMGWESEDDSVASDLKTLLTIQNIDNAIRQQEANTYIIHGSEGKGTVITANIPDDKYLLVGEGNISELTKKEYSALKSVLDAMSSLDDE